MTCADHFAAWAREAGPGSLYIYQTSNHRDFRAAGHALFLYEKGDVLLFQRRVRMRVDAEPRDYFEYIAIRCSNKARYFVNQLGRRTGKYAYLRG